MTQKRNWDTTVVKLYRIRERYLRRRLEYDKHLFSGTIQEDIVKEIWESRRFIRSYTC